MRTFQNAAMFASMTVAENLAAGRFITQRTGVWQTLFRSPAFLREELDIRKRVDELVDLLNLDARRHATARDLPYGEQRVLGLGIALMAQPKLLVLDEPAAGLSPDETRTMGRLIRKIHGPGTTVLLIEHNMSLVMSISDRVIVLKQGRRKVLNRGQTLFSQGSPHEGIYLVESGRIRVFYMAPSGREITLAYWNPGNFVGGPEIFGSGPHMWSGVAAANSELTLERYGRLAKVLGRLDAFLLKADDAD